MPIAGSILLLAALSTLFIATNLSIGYTFSTIAQNQLQAIQMSFMFFLPNILLSGFMFPFAGMPRWAQVIGECLPLTHYIRIVRGIMLKGADLYDLQFEALALAGLMLVAMTLRRPPLPPHAGLRRGLCAELRLRIRLVLCRRSAELGASRNRRRRVRSD